MPTEKILLMLVFFFPFLSLFFLSDHFHRQCRSLYLFDEKEGSFRGGAPQGFFFFPFILAFFSFSLFFVFLKDYTNYKEAAVVKALETLSSLLKFEENMPDNYVFPFVDFLGTLFSQVIIIIIAIIICILVSSFFVLKIFFFFEIH